MQITIVSYMLYQLTGDVLSLGKLGLWEAIPAIGCSFISGHFVDNKNKKSLLIFCTVLYIFLAALYFFLVQPHFQELWGYKLVENLIYTGTFIGGVLRAFLSPSAFSLLSQLVPRKLYPNATTWSSTAWQTGAVAGPLFGGLALAAFGAGLSMILVVILILTALFFISKVPRQPILRTTFEPILKSLSEGFKFLFSKQLILSVLALDMFAVLFGGAVALLPVFAKDILKVGEVGYGWLRAAPGIGSILTLMILTWLPLKKKAGQKMLISFAVFGLTIIVFGWSKSVYLSFAMLLIGGMFDAVSVVIRGTVLQLYTPDAMRGRVSAINTMFISSSNELGAAESGLTAKWFGTIPAVIFGGIMTMAVVGITSLAAPKLRKLEFDEQVLNEKNI